MNRLHHVKQCLLENILNNKSDNSAFSVEFVLLDYNSSDGLEDWIKDNLLEYVQDGTLTFYRTIEPTHFQRSHSRNMVFKLAKGDILCNIDADNFMGSGFAQYVYSFFNENKLSFLTPNFSSRDVIGKLCVPKELFATSLGYDEGMHGYGFEDLDLYKRLIKNGYSQSFIDNDKFNKAIQHGHEERFGNEYISQNIKSIYVSYLNPFFTELLFIYKNFLFEVGRISDNSILSLKKMSNNLPNNTIHKQQYTQFIPFQEEHSLINLEEDWNQGSWQPASSTGLTLILGTEKLALDEAEDSFQSNLSGDRKRFYKIQDTNFLSVLTMFKTEISNRRRMNSNATEVDSRINGSGFGKGKSFKNFSTEHEVTIH